MSAAGDLSAAAQHRTTRMLINLSSRLKAGSASLDVCETASHGVMKTKKRLLFFSSECLEKL